MISEILELNIPDDKTLIRMFCTSVISASVTRWQRRIYKKSSFISWRPWTFADFQQCKEELMDEIWRATSLAISSNTLSLGYIKRIM
jgi:hypothetical protein